MSDEAKRTLEKLEALERLARAQLEETMEDRNGGREGPLPTLAEIAADADRSKDGDWDAEVGILDYAQDLNHDYLKWRSAVQDWLDARERYDDADADAE